VCLIVGKAGQRSYTVSQKEWIFAISTKTESSSKGFHSFIQRKRESACVCVIVPSVLSWKGKVKKKCDRERKEGNGRRLNEFKLLQVLFLRLQQEGTVE